MTIIFRFNKPFSLKFWELNKFIVAPRFTRLKRWSVFSQEISFIIFLLQLLLLLVIKLITFFFHGFDYFNKIFIYSRIFGWFIRVFLCFGIFTDHHHIKRKILPLNWLASIGMDFKFPLATKDLNRITKNNKFLLLLFLSKILDDKCVRFIRRNEFSKIWIIWGKLPSDILRFNIDQLKSALESFFVLLIKTILSLTFRIVDLDFQLLFSFI